MQTTEAEKEIADYRNDLSILALRAAQQIDLARREKEYNNEIVQKLISQLRTGEPEHSSAEIVKLMAPAEMGVMARALGAYGGIQPNTIEGLSDVLGEVVGEFDKPLQTVDKGHLENLIAFCVTLHDELLSQRRSFREARKLRSKYRV